MRNAALIAIGFLSGSFSLPDSASCQTSRSPPLSLARPAPSAEEVSPPAVIMATPPAATDAAPPPEAAARRAAPPIAARDTPKPATDYDGFATAAEDEPVTKLPDLPRTAKRSKPRKEPDSIAGQPWANSPEDEALRRKLTICRDCK